MSVTSTTNRVDYTGNGATSVYSYPFKITDQDHLLVTVRNTDNDEVTYVITTNYTVSGVGDAGGGNITLVAGALTTGYRLTIKRVVPLEQNTDIRNQGTYYPEVHEDAFDYLTYVDQQQQDDIDRAMVLPVTLSSADVDTQLPIPSAGLAIGWNEDEDGLTNLMSPGSVAISAFMESVLDDTTSAAARVTLDAAQKVHSATAETTPVADDELLIYDTSEGAENRTTAENFFKVITGITADAAPAANDKLASYDSSATAAKSAYVGAILAHALRPGETVNLALAQGADSSIIKITAANGAILSATNPGYVCCKSSATEGQKVIFAVTADVSIDLTGAHYGLDTFGDYSDLQLRVYAVNDTAALKWMVALKGGLRTVASTSTSATATSVITKSSGVFGLVSSALNSGTWPCHEIGWFNSDFTDSSNEHAVQNGNGDLNIGIPVPDRTDWISYTPSGAWNTNVTYTGYYRRIGDSAQVRIFIAATGAPNSTTLTFTSAQVFNGLGFDIDTSVFPGMASNDAVRSIGTWASKDTGTQTYSGVCAYEGTNSYFFLVITAGGVLTQAGPFTYANGDSVSVDVSLPVVQWSSN